MMDFKGFIYQNDISQKDIVDYLGVSKGYMSLVISGKKKLSEENFRKLIENPYNWDTSMLTASDQPENPAIEKPEERGIVDQLFTLLREEQASNKILLQLLKEKDEKIEALLEELRTYREHKGETAPAAATSSVASAV